MTIQVTGTLVDPMGQERGATEIRVTAVDTEVTVKGMVASHITDGSGLYDFQLVNGTHEVEINFSDEYSILEKVEVDGTTPSPITLPTLLVDHKA